MNIQLLIDNMNQMLTTMDGILAQQKELFEMYKIQRERIEELEKNQFHQVYTVGRN